VGIAEIQQQSHVCALPRNAQEAKGRNKARQWLQVNLVLTPQQTRLLFTNKPLHFLQEYIESDLLV
jgi:hypothetical protein